MPLLKSKSKAALSKNIKTEMQHGKSQKQAVAIAMDVQRRAMHKPSMAKRMGVKMSKY